MENIKVRIVLLPSKNPTYDANQANQLVKHRKLGFLGLSKGFDVEMEQDYTPYELYFVSNEEINNNEYYLAETYGRFNFFGQSPSRLTEKDKELYEKYKDICYKIVATTNKSLNLPLIPLSFVEEYIENEGQIKEVMIEKSLHAKEFTYKNSGLHCDGNGNVVVSKKKETWTRDELLVLLGGLFYETLLETGYSKNEQWDSYLMNWISENI